MEQEGAGEKKDQSVMLISILALLIAIGAVIFVIVPQLSSMREASNQVLAKQSELDAGSSKVSAIKQSAQVIAAAKKDIELLGVALPVQANADEALTQAATAATDAGMVVKSIAINEPKNNQVNLSITVGGNYDQLDKYIKNLEANIRPVVVDDYNVVADVTGNGALSATFSLSFPYIAAPEATETALSRAEGATNE